jgi:hypothetical protein
MPHAEKDSVTLPTSGHTDTMGEPMTNGERPSSLTLQHLTSYPVVSDSISTYKNNPYGAKSISLASDAYSRFFVPFQPYLQTPYSFVAPYLAKADSLGDQGLTHVDQRFPIVKEETSSLKDRMQGAVFFPVKLATDGKQYIFKTYDDEYKKTGGKGLGTTVKAVISTELKVTADVFQWVADFLSQRKQDAKSLTNEKLNN